MPATFAELITAGIDFVTDLGLMPVIAASAVVGLGAWAFKRSRAAAR